MVSTSTSRSPGLASRLVNGVLNIKPVFNVARNRARTMMQRRAMNLGFDWQQEVDALKVKGETQEGTAADLSPTWNQALAEVTNPELSYPDYYLKPFHAYEDGNLGWGPALEVEVAAKTVHAQIWTGREVAGDPQGDARLRESYHAVLQAQLPAAPQRILDIGCSVGMSSFALQDAYPEAQIEGLDLSPYFLAVAQYRSQQRVERGLPSITWHHGAGESSGLPDQSFDLISVCLLFHELPQTASLALLQEGRRLLKPGGHFCFMDMNPQSEAHSKMPPYILTLLKSTEPYIDQYFSLDVRQAFEQAGFATPTITPNSPRHRTVIGRVA